MSYRPAHTVTYLAQRIAPDRAKYEAARAKLFENDGSVLIASPLPPAYFRAIYAETGRNWYWHDMLALSDEALRDYCDHDHKRLFTLVNAGAPAGFFVLDQNKDGVDLAYFGLLDDVIGKGLGGAWLDYALFEAWQTQNCKIVTVNTCTLDHPRALALYQSRGFEIINEEFRPETPAT